jgi:hypothetical protein
MKKFIMKRVKDFNDYSESPSGLAHCTVSGFNVVSWEAVDD